MTSRRLRILLNSLAVCAVLLLGSSLANASSPSDEYPLRPYYPEVPFISTEQLLEEYEDDVIVDIRSSFEYDVARINKAILLPLTDPNFATELEKLRPKTDPTPMVFYCNGHSCAKSYQATQLALSLGFGQVYTYDGGIYDWIAAAPDKATLMGETPARANRIISSEEFREKLADPITFASMAREKNTIVIDIRDPFQREVMPRNMAIRNIPLDPLLNLVVSRIWTEKRLLFFDAVGKQVRWLQYFLESYGYFDYAFLADGIRSIAEDKSLVKPVIETNRSIVSDQGMLLKLTTDTRLNNTDRKVLSYLLANVKFNNYIVVDLTKSDSAVGVGRHLILGSVKKLTQLKYATHSVMQDTLIVQVDPRLAWKGQIGDKTWKSKLTEFDNTVKK